MKNRRTIGGFISLTDKYRNDPTSYYGKNFVLLHSGRSSLHAILKILRPETLHVPELYCPDVIDMLDKIGQKYCIYPLNKDFLPDAVTVPDGDALLLVKYFVSKDPDVFEYMSRQHGTKVIIDDCHSAEHSGYECSYSFNSLRKWMPVPDGSQLFFPKHETPIIREGLVRGGMINTHHLIDDDDLQKKYGLFRDNENAIGHEPNRAASAFTKAAFHTTPLSHMTSSRMTNFAYLHKKLAASNVLCLPEHLLSGFLAVSEAPFCYPYLPLKKIEKTELAIKGIFIPTYWHGSPCRTDFMKSVVDKLLPLPIDSRYDFADMDFMIDTILGLAARA